jgi:hypothetical protein
VAWLHGNLVSHRQSISGRPSGSGQGSERSLVVEWQKGIDPMAMQGPEQHQTTSSAMYRNPFKSPWDGSTADIPCWVLRLEGEKFQVFAINCTHLGYPVRWSI